MRKIVVVLNSNTNRQSAKKNIRFEHELLLEIEEIKPREISFSMWVKEACRDKINNERRHIDECGQVDEPTQINVCTIDNNSVTPEDEQAALVLAKQWESQGLYFQQIADKLNTLGKLAPEGKTWSWLLVRQLLKSP